MSVLCHCRCGWFAGSFSGLLEHYQYTHVGGLPQTKVLADLPRSLPVNVGTTGQRRPLNTPREAAS